MNNNNKYIFALFIIIFTLSGFSGLIYQSIWSHYLKLFLGHASYAQVLVLAIFMGGMAIGAALASRLGKRISNMILFYGIAEILIGVLALLFHQLFLLVQSSSYDLVFPALGNPAAVNAYKWSIAAILILPQSILLGSTFPFLSAGLIRRFGQNRQNPINGRILATLYFVNSLGASLGVLANIFLIIPWVGLPGSLLTAGIINILLAMLVYFLSKGDAYPQTQTSEPVHVEQTHRRQPYPRLLSAMLILACLTGLASFMYEIGWIRMLTMVLGGSTHSFEIMLSAFILGLALGSWWIRPRIDRYRNPLAVLGLIQIIMGVLAALTIPLYAYTYQLMGFAMDALQPSDEGYLLYALFSYSISLLVMLPAAFCAGTTLPLATHILLKQGHDDSAIGKVYAWNTLGSIAGVIIAIQFVMPLFGLKWVILGGSLVDLVLGLAVLKLSGLLDGKFKALATYATSAVLALVFVSNNHLDTRLMASGVFRSGLENRPGEIIFHRDGKTSTVAIRQNERTGHTSILNNGKPDAALQMPVPEDKRGKNFHKVRPYTGDEPTMVLAGVLPYVYLPDAKHIANIGLGSGLTAHTLLQNPSVEQVDSIEIEQQVVEAARLFGERVANVYEDPRSHIHIDDAKTYFAAQQKQYDVIVSEPPNPWVSGVAGLFSQEFYHHIKRYLKKEGIFVQWMHIYEITPELVATIYLALATEFEYIHFYQISEADIALVVSNHMLTAHYEQPFGFDKLRKDLQGIDVFGPDDLAIRLLADKFILERSLSRFSFQANSDFFPILDQGAAKSRFRKQHAGTLLDLHNASVIRQLHFGHVQDFREVKADHYVKITKQAEQGKVFFDHYLRQLDKKRVPLTHASKGEEYANTLATMRQRCVEGDRQLGHHLIDTNLAIVTGWATETLPQQASQKILASLDVCDTLVSKRSRAWLSIMRHWYQDNHRQVILEADSYFQSLGDIQDGFDLHLLKLYLASQIALGENHGEKLPRLSPLYPGDLEYDTLRYWWSSL